MGSPHLPSPHLHCLQRPARYSICSTSKVGHHWNGGRLSYAQYRACGPVGFSPSPNAFNHNMSLCVCDIL